MGTALNVYEINIFNFHLSEIFMYIQNHIFFIHLAVDGLLVWFSLLVIINSAIKNMGVQTSPQRSGFISFGYITSIGISGS
jgi:hypothetical protein